MNAVIPAVLARTRQEFEARLTLVRPFFYKAQLDVLNDTLVPGSSFADPIAIGSLAAGITFEIHLMVDIDRYEVVGWNVPWVEKVIIHVEGSRDPGAHIAKIRTFGKRVFLAINPGTDNEAIEPFTKDVNGVMFMAVHPGRMGAPFLPEVLDKIRVFRARHKGIEIEVDGGVTNETLPALLSVGANTFAVGSYIKSIDAEDRVLELVSIIERFEAETANSPAARTQGKHASSMSKL